MPKYEVAMRRVDIEIIYEYTLGLPDLPNEERETQNSSSATGSIKGIGANIL